MVDWKPGDMWTYSDWRDKILLEMQAAGINPFIELDSTTLPSEGSNFSDLTKRVDKFYGNVVDGINIPGLQTKSDGTVTYLGENVKTSADELTALDSDSGTRMKWETALYGRLGHDDGLRDITNYDIIRTNHTLAGGALNNAVIAPNAAGYKAYAVWIIWTWDTDPAAAYTIGYHEEDQAADHWSVHVPGDRGRGKTWLYYHCSNTVNKDFQGDISGGAGAEVLTSIVCVGYE